jgi:hypothetical protein
VLLSGLRSYDFEKDAAGALRCIPMAVRYKLDLVSVKLSLRQWRRFRRVDRCELLYRSCGSQPTVTAYREYLCNLIRTRAQEKPVESPPEDREEWRRVDAPPDRIRRYAESRELLRPTALPHQECGDVWPGPQRLPHEFHVTFRGVSRTD